MSELVSRYRIIFPSEHGSWSLTITPFIIGAGIGAASRDAAPLAWLAVLLCFVAVMALFLARQPAALWMRAARGKARRADLPAAQFWSIALTGAAALAGGGLLLLGRWPVLWLALPALAALAVTLALGAALGPRLLATELIGVAGLALGAPAACVSITGRLDGTAWLAWGVSALHSVISVLYVRLRINQRHGRASAGETLAVVLAHALSLAAVLAAAWLGWLPPLIALPVGLLLVRALMVAWLRPRIEDVRRFGFIEMGAALAFALLVVLAFLSAE
jgi:hypothetical protein